jgi:hypothetical protein
LLDTVRTEFRTDRKMRLLAVAVCRVSHEATRRPELREAHLRLVEGLADGTVDDSEREAAQRAACASPGGVAYLDVAIKLLGPKAAVAARDVLIALGVAMSPEYHRSTRADRVRMCDAIRDLFRHPHLPVTFDPTWRTSTAVGLARTMCGSRDFSAMPILADALEGAGCDSADVLAHCRGPGPHVRGCWVVDLVLGLS